jgi:putative copper export protein
MRTGFQGVFQRGNSAVHLLAAGAWLGGLTAFMESLRAYTLDGLRRDAVHAMASFENDF